MLAATFFTWIDTCALRAFTDGVGIRPPEGDQHTYAYAYVLDDRRIAHICQAIYNGKHAMQRKIVPRRFPFSRARRSHSPSPLEPDRRQGNLRLLFRRYPGNEPAENLAPPGLPSAGGHRRHATPRSLDALSPSRA